MRKFDLVVWWSILILISIAEGLIYTVGIAVQGKGLEAVAVLAMIFLVATLALEGYFTYKVFPTSKIAKGILSFISAAVTLIGAFTVANLSDKWALLAGPTFWVMFYYGKRVFAYLATQSIFVQEDNE